MGGYLSLGKERHFERLSSKQDCLHLEDGPKTMHLSPYNEEVFIKSFYLFPPTPPAAYL